MTTQAPISQSRCLASFERIDITPPVGIYHRMWGAAAHDRSEGVHRPLTATVLATRDLSGGRRWIDIAMDHCLLWHQEMNALLDAIAEQSSAERGELTVLFSHTHAAGLMGWEREPLPGGDLIRPYLTQLAKDTAAAVDRAISSLQPATILYGIGRCDLAQNRDYWDRQRESYVCGFNPDGITDDTVVAGKAVADDGQVLGTMVNYACHPTTLAWDNRLISPDFVGAMREVVESSAGGPCFFIQGASGDIGPRDGFVGDVAVADRNGRHLGYAALSALEAAVGAGQCWAYQGAVVSGATIGAWAREPLSKEAAAETQVFDVETAAVPLPYREDLPDADALRSEREDWQRKEQQAVDSGDAAAAADARAMVERMTRRLTRVGHIPAGSHFPYEGQVRRLGNALWIALNGEHYNLLQRELRARLPEWTVIVGTLANGSDVWYLPDADSYGKGLYQEDASTLARGSLETLMDALLESCQTLVTGNRDHNRS